MYKYNYIDMTINYFMQMYGKIIPKSKLNNFNTMYRDSAHGPTSNHNYHLFGVTVLFTTGCRMV